MVDAADEDKLEASRYTIITLSAHCESALSLCAIPLTGSSLFYDKENCSIQVGSKLLNIIQKRADAAAGQAQSWGYPCTRSGQQERSPRLTRWEAANRENVRGIHLNNYLAPSYQ